jgi:hypothetical protein
MISPSTSVSLGLVREPAISNAIISEPLPSSRFSPNFKKLLKEEKMTLGERLLLTHSVTNYIECTRFLEKHRIFNSIDVFFKVT